MSLKADSVNRNTACQKSIELAEHRPSFRIAEAVGHLKIVFVPDQKSLRISYRGRTKRLLDVVDANVLQPGAGPQAVRPLTARVEHLIHYGTGVQHAGEVPGDCVNMIEHHSLRSCRRKLPLNPRGQGIVPHQRMSAHLDAIRFTKSYELISLVEIVFPWLMA